MAAMRIWLSLIPETDITKSGSSLSAPDLDLLRQALGYGRGLLKGYLARILSAAKLGGSYQADTGLNPHDDQVGPGDMLVYITTSSLALDFAAKSKLTLSGGSAGGITAPFAQGALSEIYIPAIRRYGGRDVQGCGTVLANLALHELAHNKCIGDPTVANQNDYVHQNGGGGLFDMPVMPAMLRRGGPNAANISFMAARIARNVPQLTAYLFSSKYGF